MEPRYSKDLEEKSQSLTEQGHYFIPAAFDAGGVFEPLLTAEDAIISDSLNHASIIDGVRLCKAARYRYANNDVQDLRPEIKANEAGHRFKYCYRWGFLHGWNRAFGSNATSG